ncbi:hypothetical protein [Microbacterium enclense]|uniref:Uncharacterized protein n=1 Tax=Microbacterium enclense TaxID=993073 RepID=A0A1G6GWZ2_9MICO|nr:hypothetical protein [Microbacterium enclense]SDB86408.1 hypothetical protein SAMN05216418_0775 [Microbacterium enclense]
MTQDEREGSPAVLLVILVVVVLFVIVVVTSGVLATVFDPA